MKFFQSEISVHKAQVSTKNGIFNGEFLQTNEQPNNQHPFVRIEENISNPQAKRLSDGRGQKHQLIIEQ